MGVFLQPDPIGFEGDAANLYRFCTNNAVNRTDPDGLTPQQDPPQKIMEDNMWESARHFDSSNTSHGTFTGGLTMARQYRNDSSQRRQAGGPTIYPNPLAAARSAEDDVGKAVKSDKSTEAIVEVGQAEDGSERYVRAKIHRGNGVGRVENSQFSGTAQNSDITVRYLPKGYRDVVGFVLGHPYYDGRFVRRDINIAKENNYKVAVIIGEVYGKGNKVVTYVQGEPDPKF
jgi:hypothetical protein